MKKTLLLLVTLITATIAFAKTEIDGIYYNLNSENKTAEVTYQYEWSRTSDYSGIITIPEKVTYNATEYSVTSIGDRAFAYCNDLTSIIIPNTIISIGMGAFESCTNLISISIPSSVTYINFDTFYWCENLISIDIDINNPNYASIDGVLYNKNITTLIRCPGGKNSINIPNSVTNFGREAFSDCYNLTSVTIPNSVISFEDIPFFACSNLTSIIVDNNNPNYSSVDGLLYDKNITTLIRCPEGKNSINIPNSVTHFEDGALYGCGNITSITIPKYVTSLGRRTFFWCFNLTSIICLGSIPPSVSDNDLDINYSICSLSIPKGSLNDYKNHVAWGKFTNIQEHEFTKFTIATTVNDDAMGSVSEGGEYTYGTEITLTATSNNGYRFSQWSDGNTDNPRTIAVTQDSTFTAIFELKEFALYATSASTELGYVEHIIRAVAIEGFEFDRWSDDNTDNPRTIVLTENTKLYAYFKMAQGGTTTDLETSKISSANIYTTNGTLHIEGATTNYHILDAAGRLIYSGNASTLTLPRGIYLITMGGEVEKIVL